MSSVGFSAIFGFFVLMAFLFSIQDFDKTLDSAYGQPVLQILVDVAGEDGALVLFSLIMSKRSHNIQRVQADEGGSLRLALRTL